MMILKPSVSPSPPELLGAGLEVWHLMVESQMVVVMRLLGMAGVWSVKSDENFVMVDEKLTGFADSALAAQSAVWDGQRPDQIMVAAIRPIRARTSSNAERLSRNGSRDFSAFLPVKVFDQLPALPMSPFTMLLVIWRKTQDVVTGRVIVMEQTQPPLLPAPQPRAQISDMTIDAVAQEPNPVIVLPGPQSAAQSLAPQSTPKRVAERLRSLFRFGVGRRD